MPSWAKAGGLRATAPASDPVGFRVYLGWQGDPSAVDRAVSTPGSPQYRDYLSAAQFRAQFAPSQSQVTAVQQWLRSQGFAVDYTPTNNLYVSAEGTVAQADTAFDTTLGEYSYDGLTLRSPERALSVPASLGVQSVLGLDDSAALVHTDHVTSDATPSPAFVNGGPCSTYWNQKTTADTAEPTPLHTTTSTITSPAQVTLPPAYPPVPTGFAPCGYTPSQLRGAYGLTSSDTGTGQTVAIIDAYASPTIVNDANQYFANHNVSNGAGGSLIPPLNSTNFRQVVAPGTFRHPQQGQKQSPQGWYGEETLDVEAVHTMAPAAKVVFVGAPNNFQDLDAALNNVVDNHLASMVTNSYGWAGEALPPGYIKPVYDMMQQAVAEGIGVYFSSGDSGDETGGSGIQAQATPDWPASSDLVTAVGGTSLAVGADNSRVGEWGWETGKSSLAGTSASNLSWTPAPPGKYLYGSGGGTSRLFAQPWYQAGVVPTTMSEINGSSTPMRVVPDASALADPTTGMLVGQTQAFPDGSVKYSEYRIGGTSLASPLFTGMMADVQALAGTDIGFANPLLYSSASNPGTISDIVPPTSPLALMRSDYANSVDASSGYLATVRSIDFDAPLTIHVVRGYDDVTGIGSPGSAFFTSLPAAAAAKG
ncbi:MAG TPA: S53 family peptidase [Acidimicrobiales bacterium]|nr:S53 family peptidase [Acidimicrobiales bacterium]